MRDYETIFILDPALDESQVKDEVGKVENLIGVLEGEVMGTEVGGKRKLAYEIDGNREGYYTMISFRLNPSSLGELERGYKLNEKVLRYIIVHAVQKKPGVADQDEVPA
jgi:small subunit ribosomal protein S6